MSRIGRRDRHFICLYNEVRAQWLWKTSFILFSSVSSSLTYPSLINTIPSIKLSLSPISYIEHFCVSRNTQAQNLIEIVRT